MLAPAAGTRKFLAVMIDILPATTERDLADIRRLFEAYSASLPIDLGLQQIELELASLPGKYAPPQGALFVARDGEMAIGCVGLRAYDEAVGEIKRMYVAPEARGQGVGRTMLTTIVAAGKAHGYDALVLDTLESMDAAISLYVSFGFRRTEAYAPSPYPETAYFRFDL